MERITRLACTILLLLSFSHSASAQDDWDFYEETTISGTISGAVKKGHILKTATGNIYEITDDVYRYVYLYNPNVIVLRKGDIYRMMIDGVDDFLYCAKLNESKDSVTSDPLEGSSIIESYIISDFDGLDYGNIYKLENGHIWEQVESWSWIWIWVRPRVTIWQHNEVYKMKVENIDHPVTVRRIK